MEKTIEGKRVAILATDGFEQKELMEPRRMLEEAGAKTTIVSLKPGEIKGWKDKNWGDSIRVDLTVETAKCDDFDALVLPGGIINPDTLRMNSKAVAFVKAFAEAGKAIGAICHGPWMLIEADAVRGRKVTSWPSLGTDLRNAGALWEDMDVVTDKGIVTSRKPDDIPAFGKKLIEEIKEGRHSSTTHAAVNTDAKVEQPVGANR